MGAEIEAKMKVESFDAVLGRLREAGAKRMGAEFETNIYFDTADRSLLNNDKGLRLRRSRDTSSGKETFIITVKGRQQEGELKNRQEDEVTVTDGAAAEGVLNALGFNRTLSFEKRRESWRLGGTKVELDELPILGRFVEIEGPDETTVFKVRKELGMSNVPLIKTSYISMLWNHLMEHRDPRRSIGF